MLKASFSVFVTSLAFLILAWFIFGLPGVVIVAILLFTILHAPF